MDVRDCVLRLHNAVVKVFQCRPEQRAKNENTSRNRELNITTNLFDDATVQNQERFDRGTHCTNTFTSLLFYYYYFRLKVSIVAQLLLLPKIYL